MTGGGLRIDSEPGKGTTVTAEFVPSHVDFIPLGDINETVLLLITCNTDRDFVFHHRIDDREFTLDTRELRGILGEEVDLNVPDVVAWMRDLSLIHIYVFLYKIITGGKIQTAKIGKNGFIFQNTEV